MYAHQRPKLDRYDDSLFLTLRTLWYVDENDAVETGEINMFVGHDYVVTVRHGQGSSLHQSRLDLEGRTGVLTHGPSAVVYAVCDKVVDDYEEVAASLQEDVDEVESSVFSPDRTDDASRIYVLKREVAEMRRAVMPLKEPMRQFADGRVEGIDDDARPFFADVYDHVARTAEVIDGLDNLLTAAFQGHLARISVQQNEDMRKISAGAALVVVPTLIAGVYGMNFDHMPELRVAVRVRLRARADGRDRRSRCGCSSRSPAGSSPAGHSAGGCCGRSRSSSHIRACPIQPAASCIRLPSASWVRWNVSA